MDRRVRRDLMKRLVTEARVIAGHFGLEYRVIEAERSNVKSRYGICYDDGTIRIRLGHAVTGLPLKYSSLVSTLCHELAHLKHFDHGPKFRAFNLELLAWARARGIYRPGCDMIAPMSASSSAQLDLGEAIRTGRLPTLRESLEAVLRSRPENAETPSPATTLKSRDTPRSRPVEPASEPAQLPTLLRRPAVPTRVGVATGPVPSQLELFQ